MGHSKITILLLEDDTLFAQTLEDFLEEEGFAVDLAADGEEALCRSYERRYDLLLLDINVPQIDGLEVLSEIRRRQDRTPAIFLTSFRDQEHLHRAFGEGADDYLKKPVDLDELLLRIKALLRRSRRSRETIMISDLSYDPLSRTLTSQDTTLTLTRKSALLLDLLLSEANRVVPKERILEHLWGWDETPSEGAMRVYINELKKAIGKERIENVKGVGYRLAL